MTIQMVTRYGVAVDLSVVIEPVQQGVVDKGPVLVQRLGVSTQRLLCQPPQLGALAASMSSGGGVVARSLRSAGPSCERRLDRLAGLGHPDPPGQQLRQQHVAHLSTGSRLLGRSQY